MIRRSPFRNMELEPLEGRVVLSQGLGTIVALGDSSTDEYQFAPPFRTHARNWAEILAYTQKADLGPLSRASLGVPRDQGFANDWAYAGATSDEMVARQLPGAARQVATGRVHYGVIFIGTDNFLYYLQAAAASPPTPAVAQAQLSAIAANTIGDIDTAAATLLAASPRTKLIVATIPGVASVPIVRAGATTPATRALVAAADAAIAAVDGQIRGLAAIDPRVAVADIAAVADQLTSSGASTVPFGGTTIHLATPGESYNDLFLGDGLHLGTLAQGLVANTILAAADAKFAAGVNVFTPGGIVGLARLVQERTRGLP